MDGNDIEKTGFRFGVAEFLDSFDVICGKVHSDKISRRQFLLIQYPPEFRSILCVGVDGESSADFFHQISSPVVTGDEFEVHTSPFAVVCFVFDPDVGNWNLSSNNLKPMPFGNEMFVLGRRLARTELREITVERFFIS